MEEALPLTDGEVNAVVTARRAVRTSVMADLCMVVVVPWEV
jgi:hypothetical protein